MQVNTVNLDEEDKDRSTMMHIKKLRYFQWISLVVMMVQREFRTVQKPKMIQKNRLCFLTSFMFFF